MTVQQTGSYYCPPAPVLPGWAGSAAASAPGEWHRSRDEGIVSEGPAGPWELKGLQSPLHGKCC